MRNSAQNGRDFPHRALVLPGLVPPILLVLALAIGAMGYQWNIHGDGALLVFSLLISSFVAFVIQASTLWKILPKLIDVPSYKTLSNFLSALFAFICIISFLGMAVAIFLGL